MKLKMIINNIKSSLLALAGSFIIVAGWNWYHLAKRPHLRFVLISLLMWAGVFFAYKIFVWLFTHLVKRFRRHPFWRDQFPLFLDKLWFVFSLLFLVFFIKNELWSLVYVTAIFVLIGYCMQYYLSHHPGASPWLKVNRTVFIFAIAIFLFQAALQYLSYRWYILDNNARFYNIVFFRAWTMACFWLLGFAVADWLFWRSPGKARFFAVGIWSAVFLFALLAWTANLSVLFYSGLHFSPTAWHHLRDSSGELTNSRSTLVPLVGLIFAVAAFIYVFRLAAKTHRLVERRYWQYYQGAIALISLFSIFAFASFKNTPERIIASSFINYYSGEASSAPLSEEVAKKLQKFGLRYDLNKFLVAQKDYVYSTSSPNAAFSKYLAPTQANFSSNKPNIIIIFLESFSSRLTSVYSNRFPDLTPGFEKMAADSHTTVFKNYYNGSTPTVTGLISELCSFLPPTGHEEIQNARKLKRLNLFCLPEALKSAGYGYSAYITAVPRGFANKGSIFESMGTSEVYAQEELSKIIKGEPLSWGYSDHQMFPALWDLAKTKKQPYLLMLSTVDTHPPFDLAKDEVPYYGEDGSAGLGANQLLNAFHTTDDAFWQFWEKFIASPLKDNTILVAVADHAVFPGAYDKKTFPDLAGKLNFYDENTFLMYVPDSHLPKEVKTYASGLDFAPTLLQVLGINMPNSFEGHSIFDDRDKYPNLLGMHELGLYINQLTPDNKRKIDYNIPSEIKCDDSQLSSRPSEQSERAEGSLGYARDDNGVGENLTLCDFLQFYKWKRQMFEEGRFWKK